MKFVLIALFANLLVACKPNPTADAPVELRLPANELVQIFKDHLPEIAANKVELGSANEEQFDLELTTDQFKHLQHIFTNEVEDYTRTKYSYDRFSHRSTTIKKGFSTFSVSIGKGKNYHYIITGSFVLVDGSGKTVVWIKPTQDGPPTQATADNIPTTP